MQNEFENALESLLNFSVVDEKSAAQYNDLFKQMVTASMKIVTETDYAALVQQKADAAEKKYGVKMEASDEKDPYRKLRDVVRFEMSREAALANRSFELCCTDSNYMNALGKFRDEMAKNVKVDQPEVIESMAQALYSDFTSFFVSATMDMVADAKIYQMKEFRPLQLNAIGKEVRTCANIVKQQNAKPQKSETVTDWFRIMFVLPALLFKKLYAVNMVHFFDVQQKYVDKAAHMYNFLQKTLDSYVTADEYKILMNFLAELGLSNCFTVRPMAAEASHVN